jgi:hypothetical protein
MARTYEWRGEAEVVVPFTLDGPRVCDTGDTVTVADDDDSFVDHPLWVQTASGEPAPTPAPVPEAGSVEEIPAPTSDPVSEDHEISDPEQPESQEPTA